MPVTTAVSPHIAVGPRVRAARWLMRATFLYVLPGLPSAISGGIRPSKAWRNCDVAVPAGRFDFALVMCQKSRVKNTAIIVRMLLIVGLIVSPMSPPVFAAGDQSMTMSAAQTG